jgi:hypothetical protein
MNRYLWKVWISNNVGEVKVVTYEKDIREVIEVCERNGHENQVSIEYVGEVLT